MFAVAQLSEDEVATINETMEALEQAMSATPKEIKDFAKIPAKVPVDSHTFIELLKTFANLLYSLFSDGLPLYIKVCSILKALNAYKYNTFKAITKSTKAEILHNSTPHETFFRRNHHAIG